MERLKEDRETRDVLVTLIQDTLIPLPPHWQGDYAHLLRRVREDLITGRLRLVAGSAAVMRELIADE